VVVSIKVAAAASTEAAEAPVVTVDLNTSIIPIFELMR
jgi:hypothetical protein